LWSRPFYSESRLHPEWSGESASPVCCTKHCLVVSQQARYAVPNIVYHLFLFFYLFQILIYFVGSMQHGLLYLFGYGDSVFLMWLHFVLKLEPRGNSFFIGMNFFVHGWNNTSAKITIFRYPKFSSCILVVVSNLFSSSNQANG
jgi:hypothetical protein